MNIKKQVNFGNNSTYNEINRIIFDSIDYKVLLNEIKDLKEDIKDASTESRRFEKRIKLKDKNEQLNQLKQAVLKLYYTFSKTEIDTERKAKAKAYFEQGKIREANDVLNDNEIEQDLEELKKKKKKKQSELEEIDKTIESRAEEFLIKAQIWKTLHQNKNWLEKTVKYYEKAKIGFKSHKIIFDYALFLEEQNQLYKSEELYLMVLHLKKNLSESEPKRYLPQVAITLNNLANVQKQINKNLEALGNYQKALNIYKSLDKIKYRYYVAGVLNNMAIVHKKTKNYSQSLEKYKESLLIYRELALSSSVIYRSNVAITLHNLGELYSTMNVFSKAKLMYLEALDIFKDLAKNKPQTFKPDVANTMNQLALLQSTSNKYYSQALKNYKQALKIRRDLARYNQQAYLPEVAETLIGMSIFYVKAIPDIQKSIDYANEVIEIADKFKHLPMVQIYKKEALQMLDNYKKS